jgi:hypothetical protein
VTLQRRLERRRLPQWLVLGAVAISTACLPVRACSSLPDRPTSLDQTGIRLGGDWLQRTTFYEDARLGSVTDVERTTTGEIGVVGTGAAHFLSARPGSPRIVEFREAAGHAELLESAGISPRYLDRGGGGWQTGSLIGHDGAVLWRPDRGHGMNDMVAGDLDGDKALEFVVGYNGGGGVHLLDSAGRQRWREVDANVWHVEIVDTNDDNKPEIVHSNASGQLTVRDASGKVLRRMATEGYFSEFSLVKWPLQRTGVLHAGEGVTEVLDFDGTVRVRLQTPDTTFLSDAHGTAVRLGDADYLALLVSASNWDRTQLLVFDHDANLRYREIMPGTCTALAAPAPGEFLCGCGHQVLRYAASNSAGAPR